MQASGYLNLSEEVSEAINAGRPVVALESTIIAHGMPFPQNIETANKVESVIRNQGAVPATIAILDGKLCAGLSGNELERLAKEKNVWKVSLRDMPYIASKKLPGATTVAATMRIASMAGIKIFATGGIGGVHRGAENTMDVSADLTEMSRTSVAVVSAGVKSILDIGLTLEYLETMGIPVITCGQDEFPSFYSRKSGFRSPQRMDDEKEIAQLLKTKWSMGLDGAVLLANPVPENKEVNFEKMEAVISEAINDAGKRNISGKELTPFLLKTIAEKTGGESLAANIALVMNNALFASKVSVALSEV